MSTDTELHEALGESQRLGFLGDRSIGAVIDHARLFVRALDAVAPLSSDGSIDARAHGSDDRVAPQVIDLGSGGGVPGLVIAHDRPDVVLTLLDRRAKRTDFLERIVRRLGWSDRVSVVCDDAVRFGTGGRAATYDVAVARGFGPPDQTIRIGAAMLRPGGALVISEPPAGDRWDDASLAAVLSRHELERFHPATLGDADRVACFRRARFT